MVDIHCHLLPGIDDGPQDMDETAAMLRMAAADGVTTIVATPHWGGRFGETPPEAIRALAEQVAGRAREEAIPVEVVPGCEAQLELDLPEKVATGQVLTFGDAPRYLLVEVMAEPIPLYALEVHFRLRTMGVSPILAHGERIAGSGAGLVFLRRFVEQGGLIQANVDSVSGDLGWRVRRLCQRLIKEGLVHVIASDGHSTQWRPPLLTPCLRGFPRAAREAVLRTYCSLEVVHGRSGTNGPPGPSA